MLECPRYKDATCLGSQEAASNMIMQDIMFFSDFRFDWTVRSKLPIFACCVHVIIYGCTA